MRRAILLSLVASMAVTVVACKREPKIENIVKHPEALKRNCDFLLERFDSAVANFSLCTGVNRQTYSEAKPFMAGGLLKSVSRGTLTPARSDTEYQEYVLNFKGMDEKSDVYVFSKTPLEFTPGQFYAVDMMNLCRFKVLQSPGQVTADLLDSFDQPKKIACK